jgi:outer membrane receptor protein involved in Fe transport
VTGFYNLNKDDVAFIRALNSPNGNAGYFSNIGETLRRGIELAGRYKRAAWEIGASYTYLKATYQSTFDMPSLDQQITITPGTRIAGLPEHFFKLASLYRVTPQWRVGADFQVFGSQVIAGNENKTTAANAAGQDKLAGYGIFNFNTNYEIQRGLNTFIRVNNIFDKRYASYAQLGYNMFPGGTLVDGAGGSNGLAPQGSVFYAPGAPRSIYAGVRYEWQ